MDMGVSDVADATRVEGVRHSCRCGCTLLPRSADCRPAEHMLRRVGRAVRGERQRFWGFAGQVV
eukprot:8843927-Alexandrium_andersonii.AAC.1